MSFFFVINLSAEEYVVYVGEAFNYNDILKQMIANQFAIKYDDDKKIYYLYVNNALNKGWIHVSAENLIVLRNSLNKYLEWEKKAIANKVKIEKKIPNSDIETSVTWNYGDDWFSADNLKIEFTFFSQTEKLHQFVISTNVVNAESNEYIDFKVDSLYLNKDQVEALLKGISDVSIEKAKKENEQKKKNEELFN